jgi:hypothetical protein
MEAHRPRKPLVRVRSWIIAILGLAHALAPRHKEHKETLKKPGGLCAFVVKKCPVSQLSTCWLWWARQPKSAQLELGAGRLYICYQILPEPDQPVTQDEVCYQMQWPGEKHEQ